MVRPGQRRAARKEAHRLLGSIASGNDPATLKRERLDNPTLNEASVLFIEDHGPKLKPATRDKYDILLRLYLKPTFGTRRLVDIKRADVQRFHCYGKSKRRDEGEEGRFRCFTRDTITKRNDDLNISWLKDKETDAEEGLTEPEDIAASIIGHLRAALGEIGATSWRVKNSRSSERASQGGCGVTDLPTNWVLVSGHDLFGFVTSGSRGWAKYYSDDGAIFIRIDNLRRGSTKLNASNLTRVALPQRAEGQRTRLLSGDILVSITADNFRPPSVGSVLPAAVYVRQPSRIQ